MNYSFPLDETNIQIVNQPFDPIEKPVFNNERLFINEHELSLRIENVASYKVNNGSNILIYPEYNADHDSIQLFLSGSILGAILHQKEGVIPFHGSSFSYHGKSFMICGHSGVGKSSVVAAFCKKGGLLINDDITPIQIINNNIRILRLKTRIKLWDDTIDLLQLENEKITKIRPLLEKYYIESFEKNNQTPDQPLHTIIILKTHNEDKFKTEIPTGVDKFELLRKNIYRRIYLKGMPQTEKKYFQELIKIGNSLNIIVVYRPKLSHALTTMEYIRQHILK